MKAIIAAGGKGTRLYPLTFTSNKHMIPIANKPLLLYPFESIVDLGIKEIGIVVNHTKPAIETLLSDGKKWGVKITYINQPEALGLAHVIKISQKFIGDSPFVYHLGDNIFTKGIQKPFDHFVSSKAEAVLSVIEHEENYRLGVPMLNKDGTFKEYVEKPKNPPNKYGIPGLYMFRRNVFTAFSGKDAIKPSARGELEIGSLYNYLADKGFRVEIAELEGEWRDPGKIHDTLEANQLLLDENCRTSIKGKVDKNSKLSGEVEIGKGSTIENSQLVGPIAIGENVTVKHSVIGPHTSIYHNCTISNSNLKYSILMEDITIENVRKPIEASMIGNNAVIRSDKAAKPSYNFTISDHSHVDVPF